MAGKLDHRAAVCIVTLALLAAACGTKSAATSGGVPSTSSGSVIDPNGTVRFLFTVPITMDPAKIGAFTQGLVYDTLLEGRDAKSGHLLDKPRPGIATSYVFATDGKYLELKLRSDVTFHDGTPFNADAVKANILRQKTVANGQNAIALASVESVTVVDPVTVRLNLVSGKGAEVPWQLTGPAGMIVSPTALAAGQDIGLDPRCSGSGPYKVVSFSPGQALVLERAPGKHWDPGVGMAKRLELKFVGDQTARLNALRSGDADIVFTSHDAYPTVEDLVKQGSVDVQYSAESVGGYGIQWHATGDLASPLVREAANLAIDRQGICTTIMNGQCFVPKTMQPFAPGYWAYSVRPDIARIEYNPDKARQLLAQAGIPHPKITINQSPGLVTATYTPVVQADLEKVGFQVTLTSQPYSDAGAAFRTGSLQAMSDIPVVTVSDPSIAVYTIFAGGKQLVPPADLPQFKALADKALDPKLDVAGRVQAYGDLWKFVGDHYYYMIVAFAKFAFPHARNIGGVQPDVPAVPDLRYVYVLKTH